MSIKSVTDKINSYKAVYLEAQRNISAVKDNKALNQEAKERRANEIKNRYAPQVEAAAERVLGEIESTQAELRSDRQRAIRQGMEKAAEIELVKRSIENGDYNGDYVRDLLEIYASNPPMIEAIRAAVKGSDVPEIAELAVNIPEDQTAKQIRGLEKAAEKIRIAPKLGDSIHRDDWTAALWQNGTAIDSLVTYLLGLEDFN